MPITIYRRGDTWHYRGTVAGRRLRGSCQTTDKKTAQRVASNLETAQWKSDFDGPAAVLTYAQAAILYRQAEKPTRFLDTIENYWRDTLVSDITAGAIRRSALTLYPDAVAATRNRQVIVPTQAVINHAAENELCPPITVKRFPIETHEREPATADWIDQFVAIADPQLGALAIFMFQTGARISEAIDVQWSDVSLAERKALIRQTKIGSERRAHLTNRLVAAIANIDGPRTGPLFKYSSRIAARYHWNKVIKSAGLKYLSFHACRHGFATTMLHAGVDPVTVAERGGWADTAQLFKTYGHANRDHGIIDDVFDAPTPQPHQPDQAAAIVVPAKSRKVK